ncbi:MAG: AAA family ATPase [Ignavibacteriae bacterium]|jgi:dephospho-CoA kinase|nr:AAA family ATPase [Ignavibacteriota bacterium]
MNKGKIVAVIGMCGSGKTEAVKYFLDKGYRKVYFGQVVLDELQRRGLDVNEVNERKVREDLRGESGMGVMALKSINRIKEYSEKDNVVIESLYSWDEFKIIKNEFGNRFKLITIYTTKSLRYERLLKRPYRQLSFEEAESRDISEIENLDKGGPVAFCDYLIINDSTIENLFTELEKLGMTD